MGRGTMALAPDGRAVATGRIENGEAYFDVLDLPSGRRKVSWRADARQLYDLIFSPDGKSLFGVVPDGQRLSGYSRIGEFRDPGTGRPTGPLLAGVVQGIYVPGSDRIVTQTDNDLWHVRRCRDGPGHGLDALRGRGA